MTRVGRSINILNDDIRLIPERYAALLTSSVTLSPEVEPMSMKLSVFLLGLAHTSKIRLQRHEAASMVRVHLDPDLTVGYTAM